MWYKIWQDSQQAGAQFSRFKGPLADPPVIKELVRAEVRMLLENLQEKFLREGRSVSLTRHLFFRTGDL